jgi:hypothetical protein
MPTFAPPTQIFLDSSTEALPQAPLVVLSFSAIYFTLMEESPAFGSYAFSFPMRW